MKSLRGMQKLSILVIPLVVLIFSALACGGEAATPTPTSTPTPAALFLNVTSPEDESTVSTGNVTVSGSTIPGAVVSVSVDDNTWIADVDQNGNFQAVVPLEAGPNLIEVVASDQQGNEQSSSISIIYVT